MTAKGHEFRRRLSIVLTALTCLAFVEAWTWWKKPELKCYNQDFFQQDCEHFPLGDLPNIVLLGSSRVKLGLVPEEIETATGKSTFNAAINGSSVVEWQLRAQQMFSKEKPDLVILGINAHELHADYSPTRAARYQFLFDDLLEYLWKDHPSSAVVGDYFRFRLVSNWSFFARRFEIKQWLLERTRPIFPRYAAQAVKYRERGTALIPLPNGYYHPSLQSKKILTLAEQLIEDPANIKPFPPLNFSLDTIAVTEFRGLLDWLTQQHIRTVLVYIPNSPLSDNRWQETEPTIIAHIENICLEFDLPFLKCDQVDCPRTNADFIDEQHVGIPFARKFSNWAARQIIAKGLISQIDMNFANARKTNAAPETCLPRPQTLSEAHDMNEQKP